MSDFFFSRQTEGPTGPLIASSNPEYLSANDGKNFGILFLYSRKHFFFLTCFYSIYINYHLMFLFSFFFYYTFIRFFFFYILIVINSNLDVHIYFT